MLSLCAAGALGGALVTAVAAGPVFATLGILLTGFSLAGIYPAALGIAGARFETHSGTVFGILFAVALSGGMSLPWAAGRIGGGAGLSWVFVLVAGCFAAILLLIRAARRVDSAR